MHAANTWQNSPDYFREPFKRGAANPEERELLGMMQRYASGDPLKTVGSNVLWKGMDPIREKDRAFVATSTRPDVAMRFLEDFGGRNKKLYRVHVPHGTTVMNVPLGMGWDPENDEHEILLFPGRLHRRGSERSMDIAIGEDSAGAPVSKRHRVQDLDFVQDRGRRGTAIVNPATSTSTLRGSARPAPYEEEHSVTQQSSARSGGSITSTGRTGQQRRAVRGRPSRSKIRGKQTVCPLKPRRSRKSGRSTR